MTLKKSYRARFRWVSVQDTKILPQTFLQKFKTHKMIQNNTELKNYYFKINVENLSSFFRSFYKLIYEMPENLPQVRIHHSYKWGRAKKRFNKTINS